MRSTMFGAATIVAAGLQAGACAVSFPEFGLEDGAGGSGVASTADAASSGGPATSGSSSSKASASSGDGGAGAGGASPTSDGGGPASTGSGEGGEAGGGGDGPCAGQPDGPIGGVDDPDDCRNHECRDGVEIEETDDSEDPVDAAPPCRLTICEGGEPTPAFADEGVSCGPPPQACDGAGTCTGCDPGGDPEQCGAATACSAPRCEDDGTCDPGFLDESTPLPDPIDGDCRRDECPGDSVNATSVDDDTDEPIDTRCGEGSCNAGEPQLTPLDEGEACIGAPGVCDGIGTGTANCHTCRDTAASASLDAGCSPVAPICNESGNGGLGVCRRCDDTASGSGTDLGCSSSQVCDPAGTGSCVDCYTDGGVAVNCAGGELCEPTGLGVCRTCYDTGAGVIDAGCTGARKACKESTDTCEQCQDAPDCVGSTDGLVCNQSGNTRCGCTGGADAPSCVGMGRGTRCLNNTVCGCTSASDCDHPGSGGPNCDLGIGGVCRP